MMDSATKANYEACARAVCMWCRQGHLINRHGYHELNSRALGERLEWCNAYNIWQLIRAEESDPEPRQR